MKKKLLSVILCVAMASALLIGCGSSDDEDTTDEASTTEEEASTDETEEAEADTEESSDDYAAIDGATIGITIQSLTNAYWAGVMSKLEELLETYGANYTLVSCEDNAGTQVSQIENFITSGCDLIMVHPSDAEAVETVCAEAQEAGIKVMCWDDVMENTDANWVLDNTELGMAIGEAAAEFINEYYTADDPAEVCVIGYASTAVLVTRAEGIKAGLEEYCNEGVYEIVAETDGIEAAEAQTNCETVLQANPDCTVFVGIGAGAMIGANEALLTYYGGAGNIPEYVGVITTDVTEQQLDSLLAGDEAVRAIVGFEGSNTDTAYACLTMFNSILDGTISDNETVYRPTMAITSDNIEEIMEGM